MGIIGLVLVPITFLLCAAIPVPFAALAIFLGLQSKREIRADPSIQGAQAAKLGIVLGIVTLTLLTISFVALAVLLGIGIASPEG